MDYRFVDTNIFIEVFARKGIKSDRSKNLLKGTKGLLTTSLVLSEIESVLRSAYLLERKEISKYLRTVLTSDILIENKKTLVNVLDFYKNNSVDWSDCLNMFQIKDKDINKVYSYDVGLNKFSWVKRLEP